MSALRIGMRTPSWLPLLNSVVIAVISSQPGMGLAEPDLEISLSSVLHCRNASHSALALRFAPNENGVAVALRHNPAFGRSSVHLIIASREAGSVRLLGDVTEPNTARDREILWWSAGGDFVASAGSKTVSIFRVGGSGQCELPFDDTGRVVGFANGPSFAIVRGRHPDRVLDSFDMKCALRHSQAVRVESYLGTATSPDGESLVFLSDQAVITDAQGQGSQSVKLDWSGGRRALDFMARDVRGRYTESGRVLCVASSYHTHCFDADSAQPTGKLPEDMKGRMSDASLAGTRIVYPLYDSTAIGLLGLAKGNVDSRLMGCSVWDYRKGREVFRWSVPRVEKIGFAPIRSGPAAVFALSAAGDCLAIARGSSLWLHALPVD